MEQFEKVVKGLECHGHKGACGEDCPYHAPGERCSEPLCADALALIRQQQERIAELEACEKRFAEWAKRNGAHVCATCGRASHNRPHTTSCPIEEHYVVPLDGGCHLWEET